MEVLRTIEFEKWLRKLSSKNKALIEARIFRLEEYGHYGDIKYLGEYLWEMRWKSGIRVYYTFIESKLILILIGGDKNGQKTDIKKARNFIKSYVEN